MELLGPRGVALEVLGGDGILEDDDVRVFDNITQFGGLGDGCGEGGGDQECREGNVREELHTG